MCQCSLKCVLYVLQIILAATVAASSGGGKSSISCSWQPYNSSLICGVPGWRNKPIGHNNEKAAGRVDFSRLSSRHQREATQRLIIDCDSHRIGLFGNPSTSVALDYSAYNYYDLKPNKHRQRSKYYHWPLLKSIRINDCPTSGDNSISVFSNIYFSLFGGARKNKQRSSVQSVDLSGNDLFSSLFSEATSPKSRRQLGAECHEFASSLQHLNLSGNAYRSWSDLNLDLCPGGGLKHLKTLNLKGNNIKALYGTIKGLTSLEELLIGSNGLKEVQNDFLTGLSSLKKLDLSDNSLVGLDLGRLPNLTELNLHKNNFVSLPDGLGRGLQNLRVLNLSSNAITSAGLSSPFASLGDTLVALDLSYNKLGKVSSEIFRRLRKLEVLTLEGNGVYSLEADAFRDLINLRVLVLSQNELTNLHPASFWKLKHLHSLSLDQNLLSNLPR